jgi:hypothetical protein
MVGLFFLLAFVNTILDSLKDTLVITATGGGAQVGRFASGTGMQCRYDAAAAAAGRVSHV